VRIADEGIKILLTTNAKIGKVFHARLYRLPAVARRDKSESNPVLTWPMLAFGLACARDNRGWPGAMTFRKLIRPRLRRSYSALSIPTSSDFNCILPRHETVKTLATTHIAGWDLGVKGIDAAALRNLPITSISVECWFNQLSQKYSPRGRNRRHAAWATPSRISRKRHNSAQDRAHQALDEFVREKVGPNGRNELSSADTLSNLEPADAQKLRALQDYAPKRGKSFIADSNRRTDCDASLKNLAAMKRSGEICRQNHVCRNN
jgi:hypothetical protein